MSRTKLGNDYSPFRTEVESFYGSDSHGFKPELAIMNWSLEIRKYEHEGGKL